MTKAWRTSYGNSDHLQMIGEIVVDYFNEVGQKIIDARKSGVKLTFGEVNPIYSRSMREVGLNTSGLKGGFNCGKSAEVCRELFGYGSADYASYITNIHNLLCDEFEGGYPKG